MACTWAAVTIAATVIIGWPRSLPLVPDSSWYIALAKGQASRVIAPFSGRVLFSLTVRVLAFATGLSINAAFLLIALLSLTVLILSLSILLTTEGRCPAVLVPVVVTPYTAELFRDYFLPDLFYAALLSIFFVLLLRRCVAAALTTLLLLYVTRESTLLLSICLVAIMFWRGKVHIGAGIIAVTFAGLILTALAQSHGLPNVHRMNGVAYLVLKVPLNFARNVLGLVLVPNTLRGTPGYTCDPALVVNLPRLRFLGNLNEFGVCAPNVEGPLTTLLTLLTIFGIGPIVLFQTVRTRWRKIAAETDTWLVAALLYGTLSFVSAPLLGASVERLAGYGWPVFWLTVPALFVRFYPTATLGIIAALLVENFAACWIPYALVVSSSDKLLFPLTALSFTLIMQGAALWTLRRNAVMPGADSGTCSSI